MSGYRDLSNLPVPPDNLAGVVLAAGQRQADPTQPMLPMGVTPQQIVALAPVIASGQPNTVDADGNWLLTLSNGQVLEIPLASLVDHVIDSLPTTAAPVADDTSLILYGLPAGFVPTAIAALSPQPVAVNDTGISVFGTPGLS